MENVQAAHFHAAKMCSVLNRGCRASKRRHKAVHTQYSKSSGVIQLCVSEKLSKIQVIFSLKRSDLHIQKASYIIISMRLTLSEKKGSVRVTGTVP